MRLRQIFLCPLAIIFELLMVFLTPIPILFLGGLRSLIPCKKTKKILSNAIESCCLSWVFFNHFILRTLLGLQIEIIGAENIPPGNYFVIANHQSWVDILMLEEALRGKTGFSRYFIKKNLLHIPLAGWVCRVLNYPYMYRFKKEHLAKHPEDKGKDVLITKRACKKLHGLRFKMNNFPEGTRFTKIKHTEQQSPYKHLLKPKSGGIAYALQILHKEFDAIIDMTIIYSSTPNIFNLFLGKMGKVTILMEKLSISPDLIGDYDDDRDFRVHFQSFITYLWEKKDLVLEKNYRRIKASNEE